MNLVIWGLILDIMGVSILTITSMINPWHGRREDLKFWNKERYWWIGWRPLFRNTETKKLVWMWRHKPVVHGWIPPRHKLEIIGFLLILIGFALQLKFYLN